MVFDHFQELRAMLKVPNHSPNSITKCTSIDLLNTGDFLIVGYSNGLLILWDPTKGTSLKHLTTSHSHPITNVRFYKRCEPAIISVDSSGLVNKIIFARTIFSSYSIESECLLDGSAGAVPALHVLPPPPASSSPNHPCRTMLLVALSSERR